MWIIIIALALMALYAFLTIAPNCFVKRGINPNDPPRTIVAHRGGADLAPENTLACIERGMEAGAHMIEIDIHLSKDNRIIVCHDQSIDRTTNGSGLIREMTLEELKQYAITDEEGNPTDQHLPTLEEVLELINGQTKLLIEIKRTDDIYAGIEGILLATLKRYQATDWCVVQSFNDSVLENIHALDPSIRLEKLIICKFFGLPFIFDGTFTQFNLKKYDYIASFNFYYQAPSRQLINKLHRAGKEVKIWTLLGPDDTPNIPVDGIITNRPDLFELRNDK